MLEADVMDFTVENINSRCSGSQVNRHVGVGCSYCPSLVRVRRDCFFSIRNVGSVGEIETTFVYPQEVKLCGGDVRVKAWIWQGYAVITDPGSLKEHFTTTSAECIVKISGCTFTGGVGAMARGNGRSEFFNIFS